MNNNLNNFYEVNIVISFLLVVFLSREIIWIFCFIRSIYLFYKSSDLVYP